MNQKIIVVIGDSLGAPRPWVGVNLRRTYAFQLAALLGKDHFVVNYSTDSNSSVRSAKQSFLRTYVSSSDISYAVIQLGIVDCAPRVLSNFDRLLGAIAVRSRFFDFFFKPYVKIKSRYRYMLTKHFPKTLVPPDKFEINYRLLVNELLSTNPIRKIYLLDVAFPGNHMTERSFNILGNIKTYNRVIYQLAQEYSDRIEIISIFEQTKENLDWITAEDGHHLMPEAHDWIAKELHSRIHFFV